MNDTRYNESWSTIPGTLRAGQQRSNKVIISGGQAKLEVMELESGTGWLRICLCDVHSLQMEFHMGSSVSQRLKGMPTLV